jgi:hypothetical protein
VATQKKKKAKSRVKKILRIVQTVSRKSISGKNPRYFKGISRDLLQTMVEYLWKGDIQLTLFIPNIRLFWTTYSNTTSRHTLLFEIM